MATRPCSSKQKLPKFTELNDLCSHQNGASILFATDDWFAAGENLLEETDPEWKEGVYDDYGKWMDGWETRRKRISGHDWCIIQLAYPCVIHGIDVDTSYFTGNYTPKVSIQGALLKSMPPGFKNLRESKNGKAATKQEFENVSLLNSQDWVTLVDKSSLNPGYVDCCHNYFEVDNREKWTHVRLNMFPDGGIARLRIYGQVRRHISDILAHARRLTINQDLELIDLVALENGGICLGYSDAHYGHPRNMIASEEPLNMGQGWETARRLDRPEILTADDKGILKVPGKEYSIFRLGIPGHIFKVQIDTTHFKGNFPDSFQLEAGFFYGCDKDIANSPWALILPRTKLGPHQKHFFDIEELSATYTHVRLTMAPDGGIARLRIWGKPSQHSNVRKISTALNAHEP